MRQQLKRCNIIINITKCTHHIDSLYVGASVQKKTSDLDMSLTCSITKKSVFILADKIQADMYETIDEAMLSA